VILGAKRRALEMVAVAVAAAALAYDASAQRTMRCGNGRLVHLGMVSPEILARCGEPKSRSSEEIPVRARLPTGARVQSGTTLVERWTFERGQGEFDAVLRVEDGKLISVDFLTQR
jgi:hypothetical protein